MKVYHLFLIVFILIWLYAGYKSFGKGQGDSSPMWYGLFMCVLIMVGFLAVAFTLSIYGNVEL